MWENSGGRRPEPQARFGCRYELVSDRLPDSLNENAEATPAWWFPVRSSGPSSSRSARLRSGSRGNLT